nr:hypothetical protein [Tanacetum cinerariifolium]
MANIIPHDHVDDLPIVELNQPDVLPVIPKLVLVDEDEDPKEEEFEEEEEPQEEEDDMEVDIEEDENEPKLTYPYEDVVPLNSLPLAFQSEPQDVIKVEDTDESEDETIPSSVHELEEEPQEEEDDMEVDIEEDENEPKLTYPYEDVVPLNSLPLAFQSEPQDVIKVEDTDESEDETIPASVHELGKSKRRVLCKLILDLGNKVQSSMEEETAAMKNLVRKLGNAEEKAECKKLMKELEEARFSNTLLHMQNEKVERDLYWTRVQAHEFYREMILRGFVFKERPNKAINVLVEDEESPSSEPWGSFHDS